MSRYVILDRGSKFDAGVMAFLQAAGLEPKWTSIQAPRKAHEPEDKAGESTQHPWLVKWTTVTAARFGKPFLRSSISRHFGL
jgi:hypothetical protein